MSNGNTIKFSGKGQAGNPSDPHNWTGGVLPGTNDTALTTTNIGGSITGTFNVNNMMLLGTEQITVTGTLNTAGVGACKGLMVCDGAAAVFAPGATLNDGNVLIVGNEAVGTMLVQGTGTTHSVINTVNGNVGKHDAGIGTVTIDDGIWKNSGHIIIGDEGKGTLNVINNGVVLVGGNLDMAASATAGGTITIATGGSVSVIGTFTTGGAATPGSASVSVGAASSLTVNGTCSVGTGGEIDLTGGTVTAGITAGGIKIAAGGAIAGTGTLAAPDGVAIRDDGTIRAEGGILDVAGSISGTGSIQIAAGSTALLTGSSLKLSGIAFMGVDATLSLTHGSTVIAPISGFAIGDMIAMANIDSATFQPSSGILTISHNNTAVASLHMAGNFTGELFAVQQTAGGTVIALQHS